MSDQFRTGSAKIYQFPRKISSNRVENRQAERPVASFQASRPVFIESGGGWYHDAAIQAMRPQKK